MIPKIILCVKIHRVLEKCKNVRFYTFQVHHSTSSSIPRTWTSIMQNPTIPTKFAALQNATKIHCKIQSTFGVKWPIKLESLRPPCLGSMITSIIWVPPTNVAYFLRKITQQFTQKNGRVIKDLTNPGFLLI